VLIGALVQNLEYFRPLEVIMALYQFSQPAEWEPHKSCWLAWPSHEDLWGEILDEVQREFVALCTAIADPDPATGFSRGEHLEILVPDAKQLKIAQKALVGLSVHFHLIPFGDIWIRDTAPVFMKDSQGKVTAFCFGFNGWGGKYELPHDSEVSAQVAQASGCPSVSIPWILEGGSIEVDGEGTCLTSRQCLLNPNRNPHMGEAEIEKGLQETYGVQKVIWLNDGLLNDHTDGHIDTIARFAAPGLALCMEANEADDPNRQVMLEIAKDLEAAVDAQGRKLTVVRVPSPGKITDEDGRIMPASYLNFYISNKSVIVPTYGSPYDADAVAIIAKCFPSKRTVGRSAKAILEGGGAFHCITQQVPV